MPTDPVVPPPPPAPTLPIAPPRRPTSSLITDLSTPLQAPMPPERPPAAPIRSSLITDLSAPDRLTEAGQRPDAPSPDQAARIYAAQRKTGLPLEVVQRNLDQVERDATAADFNAQDYRRTSPLLEEWLAADPNHLALVADDLKPLTAIEKTLNLGRHIVGAIASGYASTAAGLWGGLIQSAAELPIAGPKAPFIEGMPAPPLDPPIYDRSAPDWKRDDGTQKGDGFLGILKRPDGKVESELSIADSEKLKDAAGNYLDYPSLVPTLTQDEVQTLLGVQQGDVIPERIKDKAEAFALARQQAGLPFFAGPGEQRTDLFPELERAGTPADIRLSPGLAETARIAAAIAKGYQDRWMPNTAGMGNIESGAYSGLQSVGQMIPTLAIGMLMGPEAALAVSGFSTGGQAYSAGREEGLDPATSLVYGTIQGAVEVGTEYLPIHELLGDLKKHSGLILTLAHQIVPEIGGEEVATALQDLNDWAFLPSNKDKTFADYLRARPDAAAQTLVATVLATGISVVGTKAITRMASGPATKQLVMDLGKTTEDSKTAQRSPEKFADAVNQMAEGGATHLYAPTDAIKTYAQQQGVPPEQIAQQLTGDPQAYQHAIETNTDLAIPTGNYAAQIAGTPANAFFANELRLAPDQMNAREFTEFQAEQTAEKAQAAATARAEADAAHAALVNQIVAVGHMDREAAGTAASILSRMVPNVADRANLDLPALLRQWMPQIEASRGVEGSAAAGAVPPPLTQEEAPAPAVVAAFGGDVMVHGSPSTLDTLHPGSMFSNDPIWAAGYATTLGQGDTERFTGSVHTLDIPAGPTVAVRSVHGAEAKVLELARHYGNANPASLREAAETVAAHTDLAAIVSHDAAGRINGGILIHPAGVVSHVSPSEAVAYAAQTGRPVPSNLLAALTAEDRQALAAQQAIAEGEAISRVTRAQHVGDITEARTSPPPNVPGAEFYGYQETGLPDEPPFPLYEVGRDHFSREQLVEKGIPVPETPAYGSPEATARAKRTFYQASGPAPLFYSRIVKAVDEAPQDKATGDQWIGIIRNKMGIVPDKKTGLYPQSDEAALTQLDDLKGSEVLTRQEVQAFLDTKGLKAVEVVLGEPNPVTGEIAVADEDEEIDEDSDEFREQLYEIEDEMAQEEEQNLDMDDIIGSSTSIEDEDEREEPKLDADGEEMRDEDGDVIYETVTETRYWPAIEGGYRPRRPDPRTGRQRYGLEYRSDPEIIEDAESYDTEREAERAAERHLNSLDLEPYYEHMAEQARENIDHDEAHERTIRHFQEEGRRIAGQAQADALTGPPTHYETYSLKGGVPGTYREAFVTVPALATTKLTRDEFATNVYGERDPNTGKTIAVTYESLNDHQKSRVDAYLSGTPAWTDGHDSYDNIPNPIVRLRVSEHVVLPQDETKPRFLVPPPEIPAFSFSDRREARALQARRNARDEWTGVQPERSRGDVPSQRWQLTGPYGSRSPHVYETQAEAQAALEASWQAFTPEMQARLDVLNDAEHTAGGVTLTEGDRHDLTALLLQQESATQAIAEGLTPEAAAAAGRTWTDDDREHLEELVAATGGNEVEFTDAQRAELNNLDLRRGASIGLFADDWRPEDEARYGALIRQKMEAGDFTLDERAELIRLNAMPPPGAPLAVGAQVTHATAQDAGEGAQLWRQVDVHGDPIPGDTELYRTQREALDAIVQPRTPEQETRRLALDLYEDTADAVRRRRRDAAERVRRHMGSRSTPIWGIQAEGEPAPTRTFTNKIDAERNLAADPTLKAFEGGTALLIHEAQPPRKEQQIYMPSLFLRHWRAIAMKAALYRAALNPNIKAVIWTHAQQQVDFYPSIASVVNTITWEGAGRGQEMINGGFRRVDLALKNGKTIGFRLDDRGVVLAGENLTDDEKARFVGKPMAAIIGDELTNKIMADSAQVGQMSGEGLIVGSEGLKSIYDVDLRRTVQDLPHVKKLGAKVELFNIETKQHNKYDDIISPQQGIRMTDELRAAILGGGYSFFQPGEDGPAPRAAITFDAGGRSIISLFQNANLSSLIHEFGHLSLTMLSSVADQIRALAPEARTTGQSQILLDMKVLDDWLVDKAHTGPGYSVKQQEQMARGFEAYLMEGKSPSADLRRAFSRIKGWMLSVYRDVKGLSRAAGFPVQLNDDVRAVFDRLLASDDEIKAAEAEGQVRPMFATAAAAGMTDQEFLAYRETARDMHQQAVETLEHRLFTELKAQERAKRKADQGALRTTVAAEVAQRPVYKALAGIERGTQPDGQPLKAGGPAEPMKLSSAHVTGTPAFLRRFTSPDGVHPDVAAEVFGFPSGAALVEAMKTAPSMARTINADVQARTPPQASDSLTDGTLHAQATRAVGDHQMAIVRQELAALARLRRTAAPMVQAEREAGKDRVYAKQEEIDALTGDLQQRRAQTRSVAPTIRAALPSVADLQAHAIRRVSEMTVGDLKPGLFLSAARRASLTATEAAGRQDVDGAIRAKQQELVNLAVYKEVQKTLDDLQGFIKTTQQFSKPDATLARTRSMDLVYAARMVADTFLHPDRTPKTQEAIDLIQRYDPDLADTLTDRIRDAMAGGTVLKDLTVDQFQTMRDTTLALWTMARRVQQVVIEGKRVARETATDALKSRLADLGVPDRKAGYTSATTAWDRTQMYLLGALSALRRTESWVDAMDGGEGLDNLAGVYRKYLWTPISQAGAQYRLAKTAATAAFLDLVTPIAHTLTRQQIAAPELVGSRGFYTFSGMAEVLGALQHAGNTSNLEKFLLGREWGSIKADGTLDTSRFDAFRARLEREGLLTREHYLFLQGVWDLFESQKAQAQATHHDLYGYYFNEVSAHPLQTSFGTFRGGYVPAIADPMMVPDANVRNDKSAVLEGNNSFMFPTTGRGFTKARVRYNVPLTMDVGLVPMQLDKVLKFIHLEPRVKDVARLVTDRSFRAQLDAFDPTIASEMLMPWLQRSASQRVSSSGSGWAVRGMNAFARTVRARVGLNIMSVNVVNALQQFTGAFISGVKVNPRYLGSALFRYLQNPRAMAEANSAASDWMKTESNGQGLDMQQQIDDILLNPSPYERVRDFAAKHGRFLSSGTQNIVNHVTFAGAYDQATAEGATHPEAVRAADAAVRQTQGTFAPEDISRFETGPPIARVFTMFASYFNMQANLLGTEFTKVARDMGLRKGAGRALYLYSLGFMLPAVLSEVIRQAVGGRDYPDDWEMEFLSVFFGSQGRALSTFVPGVGPLINTAIAGFDDLPWNDRLSTSPAISAIENSVHAPAEVYKSITSGHLTKRAVQDTLTAVGLMTGVPVAPLGKPLGYAADVHAGKVRPPTPLELTRGLVTGRTPQPQP